MESFWLLVLIIILLVSWIVLRDKLKLIEQRLAPEGAPDLPTQVRGLELRLIKVEQELSLLKRPVESVPPEAVPKTEVSVALLPIPVFAKPEEFIPPVAAINKEPSFGERLRKSSGSQEWEAMVGGSLLNKIGALVLVIGIALFLGYSLTHLTPARRALTSLAVSLFLLGSGTWLERSKKPYAVFARGLMGAGWAALYVTTYAAYALPAARLITNPFIGSVLLLTVATVMIVHSLRYQAQAVTTIAYISAFAALAITPSSMFAVLGLLPLAASLLFLAHRFRWNMLALFGVVAAYATCLSRSYFGAELLPTQGILLVYWLAFEALDWQRVKKRIEGLTAELVFTVNAIGFLGLSRAVWWAHAPDRLWVFCGLGAALYLASAIVRFFIRPQSGFSSTHDLVSRVKAGSYEASAAISAILTGFAIAERTVGVWQGTGFAVEAEVLYLMGVFLELRFLRWMGNLGFALSLSSLVLDAFGESFSRTSSAVHRWSMAALFQAAMLGVNRTLRYGKPIYSYLAVGLLGLVIAAELPARYIGIGWLVLALVLLEFGIRRRLLEFRMQSYAFAVAGAALTTYRLPEGIWTAALAVIVCYLAQWRSPVAKQSQSGALWNVLDNHSATFWSLLGTALLTILFSYQFPGGLLTMAWGGEALVLLSIGFPLRERVLRLQGLAVFGVCIAKLFFYDLRHLETLYRILSFIALGILLLAVSWVYTRFRERINRYF